MSLYALDIPAARIVANDAGDVFAIVAGEPVPIGRVALWRIEKLRRLNEAEQRRWREAQTGPEPGPGGLYPEGSQQ